MRKPFKTLLAGLLPLAAALPAHAQGGYGASVAAADGHVFVGEPMTVMRPAAVYVYRPGAQGGWTEVARLTAPDGQTLDGFGSALAAQGTLLLAAKPTDGEGRGAVYAFERRGAGGEWRQAARLVASDAAPGAAFGGAVALDGDAALISSPGGAAGAGAVYVFRRGRDGRWAQEARLTATDAQPGDRFGAAVALQGDRAVIGAPMQGRERGGAYLFRRDAAGAWKEEARMVAQTVGEGDQLGASVAILRDYAVVAAPYRDRRTGAVYLFEKDANSANWVAYTRLLPFEGSLNVRFGSAVAVAGEELWIGAPGADNFIGTLYRFRWDQQKQDWVAASKLAPADGGVGDAFGAVVAVAGNIAVSGVPGDDFGAGTAVVLARASGGDWAPQARVASEAESFAAVTGKQVDCRNGAASVFGCSNVDLLGFLPVGAIGGQRGIQLNDIWGWTDPTTGREYALVGRMDGTSFVDVTEPTNPRYLGDLPMTQGARAAAWRDIKVYRNHAFIVADGSGKHGMQVFDLTRLRDVRSAPAPFTADHTYDRIFSAHNIVINEDAGLAFAVGSNSGGETCGGGLHMIDIRDPKKPRFAGCFADTQTGTQRTGYTHDAQCVTYRGPDRTYAGREICFGANETMLSIADVTDRARPVAISRAAYPNVAYSHQGWLTEDQRYFYMDDEGDELNGSVQRTRTVIWDVSDLDDPQVLGEFLGTTAATDHNLYIRGDTMYQSNYQSGLRVIDIGDRKNPREVGYFDTVPHGENKPGFGGSWSNYPFFKSGSIVVTSGREGLFIVKNRKPVS